MPYKNRDQNRKWQREWTDRRKAFVAVLKEERGNACERCGYGRFPQILQFHHRDPSQKKFGFNQRSRSEETMRKEAAKCDLLCPNCHMEEHLAMLAAT